MEKEKVRPIDKMPVENKLPYCKLLALMVGKDQPINQLKLAELYRLMANIRVATNTREAILNFLVEPTGEVKELCQEMLQNLNHQEKNILRFSLIKDLIIIVGADYVQMPEEKELLKEIEEILEITEEQKQFLKEEYQQDQTLEEGFVENKLSNQIVDETISKALALGIPLAAIYFGGQIRGFGPLGTLLGLEQIGGKRYTKKYSSAVGLGLIILGAFSTYHLVKWGLSFNRDDERELKELIHEKMSTIHQRAIQYLKRDIEIHHEDLNCLLSKTLAFMSNTKPRII
ncbi:hypothetical protein [Alkaliphilus transvaalensis]|uniref:hypothetical protein n=1 Tax=Alkaliphilus transvaalensis TaxID=114628 RepID=UPI00047B6C2D|nr:hypothetical protein [Alkaliphilus transvaalensis]